MNDDYRQYTDILQSIINEIEQSSMTVKNTVDDQLIYLCVYGVASYPQNTKGEFDFNPLTKKYMVALLDLIDAIGRDMNESDNLNDFDEIGKAVDFLLPYTKWCIKLWRALDHRKYLLSVRKEDDSWRDAWESAEGKYNDLLLTLRGVAGV